MIGMLRWLYHRVRMHGRVKREAQSLQALEALLLQVDEALADARAEIAHCRQQGQRYAAGCLDARRTAARMLVAARHALQGQHESLAREAITRHVRALRQADRNLQLLQHQQMSLSRIEALQAMLEEKRDDIEQRRESLFAHRQLARVHQALRHALSGREAEHIAMAEEGFTVQDLATTAYHAVTDEGITQRLQALDECDQVESLLHLLREDLARSALPVVDDDHDAPNAERI
jgi:phage shock protein A